MIGILTQDSRFYSFLLGVLSEHRLTVVDPARASLLIVDLDTVALPADKRKRITVSSSIFEESDLTRPFLQSELIALCQKGLGMDAADEPSAPTAVRAFAFTLGASSVWVEGEEIALTPAEHRLLSLLYQNRRKPVSLRDCEAVCRVRAGCGNSVSVTVASLRKKLDYRFERRMILSLRGQGYCLMI